MTLYVQDECAMKQQYPGHACTNYGDCPRPRKPTLSVLASTLGLVECPECEDGLLYGVPSFTESHPLPVPCPSCVSGLTPDPEIVEIVAEAEWDDHITWMGAKPYSHLDPDAWRWRTLGRQRQQELMDHTRAGLLAYLAWIEERL